MLPKRIVTPVQRIECKIFPRCNEKSSSLSTVEKASSAIEARLTGKVIDLFVEDGAELRYVRLIADCTILIEYNLIQFKLITSNKIMIREYIKIDDELQILKKKLHFFYPERFKKKSSRFSVVEIPISAVEAVDIYIKDDAELRYARFIAELPNFVSYNLI